MTDIGELSDRDREPNEDDDRDLSQHRDRNQVLWDQDRLQDWDQWRCNTRLRKIIDFNYN